VAVWSEYCLVNKFFPERLLTNRFIEGVALLSTVNAKCIYATGLLKQELEQNPQSATQFANLFPSTDPPLISTTGTTDKYYIDGWRLCGTKFCVFRKTETSIYATTHCRQFGLCVSQLPFGTLLCLYSTRISQQVIPLIEKFCEALR
jgi:hypothetical protein